MKKNYIMPQTEAQTICVSQLMTGSGDTTIGKGGNLNGKDKNEGGIYVF